MYTFWSSEPVNDKLILDNFIFLSLGKYTTKIIRNKIWDKHLILKKLNRIVAMFLAFDL